VEGVLAFFNVLSDAGARAFRDGFGEQIHEFAVARRGESVRDYPVVRVRVLAG
jgi:hypothetical protein